MRASEDCRATIFTSFHTFAATGRACNSRAVQSDRPLIVFLPGIWGGDWLFENFVSYFAQNGFAVCAIQLLRKHDHKETLGNFADRVKTELGDYTGPIILVGHSAGAQVALALLSSTLPIVSVVLISPAPPRGVRKLPTVSMVSYALRLLPSVVLHRMVYPKRDLVLSYGMNCIEPGQKNRILDMMEYPEYRCYLFQLAFRPVKITNVGIPALVFGGEKDRTIPEKFCRGTAEILKADYVTLPNSGHFSPLEKSWKSLANIILNWVGDRIIPNQ